ncbi:HPF/RaiA family ribosome-associated protein [Biformimicrobium ophioploci]|uniref:Ribosomal subunit interface protein n=1 Tax=Biformimicrobium ophioploci TaxID=3036711 RepID=A0ABQ6M1X8_9GAMM|nr:HPF/RaiA family ribosome-associated protein [Microbulbifer sp. NKW57]GMG88328.1 hypothetical protein MNKW57_26490 [Microbulbifer sp. NKW57]
MKSAPYDKIFFRDLDKSPTLAGLVAKKLEKLERFSDDILSSRVVLEAPHQHKHKGKNFKASIELGLRGDSVTISNEDESIHKAVISAFESAERRVKARRSKKIAKRHQPLPHQLEPAESEA